MAIQSLFDNIEPNYLNRYLLQVNRIKLQDYVQRALIAPDSYFDDEIEKDIQSKNPNFLVVSDGYIKELDEHQVFIELMLTKDEKKRLHRVDEVSYFDFPLPITRIKKVYAQDHDVKQHILVNILNNEKGFLPERLTDVYTNKNKPIFEARKYSPLGGETTPLDYQQAMSSYDKRMGMFAFMKNTNLYYHETTRHISNYSDNYFAALSSYLKNKLVDIGGFQQLNDVLSEYEDFKTLLNSSNQIDIVFLEKVAERIENLETKEMFSGLLKENAVRKTLPLLLEKELGLYLIGLVYYFRKRDASKKDNFKIDIGSLIPFEVAEVSLAVLGIYLGYTNLRPSETIEIKDATFQKIFGSNFNMKFQLDSKLDYITIESIYTYCFDSKKGYEFEYLMYPKKPKRFKLPSNDEFKKGYELISREDFFGVISLKLKKLSYEEISQKRLQTYPHEIRLGKHHIFSYFAKYFPNCISISHGNKELYCTKNEFLEKVKDGQSYNQYRELECLFGADENGI